MVANDGAVNSATQTVTLTVNPVNDAPVNTVPGAQVVNEDTALALGGISVNDVDGNLSTVQLGVTQGTVTVNLAGGATISSGANGTATLTLAGTQAQINAALGTLVYQGTLNYNGPGYAHGDEHGRQCGDRCGHGDDHGEPGQRCPDDHGAGRSGDPRGRHDGGAALYGERRGDGRGQSDGDGGEQQYDDHPQRQPDPGGPGRRQLDHRRHAGAQPERRPGDDHGDGERRHNDDQ